MFRFRLMGVRNYFFLFIFPIDRNNWIRKKNHFIFFSFSIRISIEMIFHLFAFDPVVQSYASSIRIKIQRDDRHSIDDIVTIQWFQRDFSCSIPNRWEWKKDFVRKKWFGERKDAFNWAYYRSIMWMEFEICSFTTFERESQRKLKKKMNHP